MAANKGPGSAFASALLPANRAIQVFLAFAVAYFFAALLRAITATLAPVFSETLALDAGDLGLLAGAYFLGFALFQLPLGRALDRWGPRRTLVVLMLLAVLGCLAFSLAQSLNALIAARFLTGAGLAACLMAPLTCFRRILSPAAQLRANSWMLMTGSLGMLASTLPVQGLLPLVGWRGLFLGLAGCLLMCLMLVAWRVPRDPVFEIHTDKPRVGYRDIAVHPLFIRMAPLGFVLYGGMIAIQSLWAGPWLTQVVGVSPSQAARGLFAINLSMLCAFMVWGAVMPQLVARGFGAVQLMRWGLPLPLLLLALNLALGSSAGAWHWAAWCVSCTFVSLSQPAIGVAFPAELAGRALSAFNLVIFSGVFSMQWGLGLAIDGLQAWGQSPADAFRLSLAGYGLLCLLAYAWFLWRRPSCAAHLSA